VAIRLTGSAIWFASLAEVVAARSTVRDAERTRDDGKAEGSQ